MRASPAGVAEFPAYERGRCDSVVTDKKKFQSLSRGALALAKSFVLHDARHKSERDALASQADDDHAARASPRTQGMARVSRHVPSGAERPGAQECQTAKAHFEICPSTLLSTDIACSTWALRIEST